MASQIVQSPIELGLYKLLQGHEEMKDLCVECNSSTPQELESYINNKATRSKIVLTCASHLVKVATNLWKLQGASRQAGEIIRAMVQTTPLEEQPTGIQIFDFTLHLKDRVVFVLLGTHGFKDSADLGGPPTGAHQGGDVGAEGQRVPYPDPDSIVATIQSSWLHDPARQPLSETQKASIPATAQANLDLATQVVDNAYEQLLRLGANEIRPGVSQRIRQSARELRASLKEVGKLAKEKKAPKVDEDGHDVVEDEAVAFMKQDPQGVLSPHEKANLGNVAKHLDTL